MKRVRPVAQQHERGAGAACVASVLEIPYAQAVARLGARPKPKAKPGSKSKSGLPGSESERLLGVLNDALADTGLTYEIDQPFIGDPESLETGSIVALMTGHYLVRADEGWMDPSGAKIRRRLPDPVLHALVLTPDLTEPRASSRRR